MRLLKSTAIIGFMTAISRVLGLVRDILIARFLGAGHVPDAYFMAFKFPNIFRRMFAEGAFNAAFIPLYARRIEEEGATAADGFASEVMAVLFVTVAAIVILFEVTMPWSFSLIGFGLDRTLNYDLGTSTYGLAVVYAQITMPYLLFMSMTALFSGILNTRHHFALAAGVPIILNLFLIGTLAMTDMMGWGQVDLGTALAVAITVSGLAQMGMVLWGCRRAGVKVGWRRPKLTPGVKRLIILGVPGAISAGITQINLLVSSAIAGFKAGAVSWLTYADRLYQLPLGIIGIAMGVALLPSLSRQLRSDNELGARLTLNRGIELTMLLTLPAAFALAVIPEFLIEGLFQRGEFMADTTTETAKAVRMFAYGTPAFVLLKVLTPAFFARENTRTPMIFAGVSAVINIALGLYLFFILIGFEGLALATSIAGWVNVIGLTYILLKDGDLKPDMRLLTRLPRMIVASAIMAVGLFYVSISLRGLLSGHILKDFMVLGTACGIGFAIYVAAAALLRAFHMSDIRSAFRRS